VVGWVVQVAEAMQCVIGSTAQEASTEAGPHDRLYKALAGTSTQLLSPKNLPFESTKASAAGDPSCRAHLWDQQYFRHFAAVHMP
jgi:hypothetical protein